MTEKAFSAGQRVVYVPLHAHGNLNHIDCERGVVTSVGSTGIVFVRYADELHSKATTASDLMDATEYFNKRKGK